MAKNTETKNNQVTSKNNVICAAVAVFALAICGYMYKTEVHLNDEIQKLNVQLKNSRKIYIYNLEKALQEVGTVTINQKFAADIAKLDEEVKVAEKKIKSLKDSKVKDDFSDVYLNSLRLKRDTLLEEYQKSVQGVSDKINKILADIAVENNAATIFNMHAISVKTDDLIDVTPEVIKRLQVQ